jgi:hypothetical protein
VGLNFLFYSSFLFNSFKLKVFIMYLHRLSFFLAAIFLLLLTFKSAPAQKLTFAIEQPGTCVIPDATEGILHRTDTGEPIDIPYALNTATIPTSFIYFIPTSGENPASFKLRFRIEDIPLDQQASYVPGTHCISISGVNLASSWPTITGYKLGTGDHDFIEFTASVNNLFLNWGSLYYYTVNAGYPVFSNGWSCHLDITFANPYEFLDATPPEGEACLIDKWFRLIRYQFPDSFTDGAALPSAMYLDNSPVAGEQVQVGGENVLFEPDTVSTDANGRFGVVAFVDPESFDNKALKSGLARTAAEKADATNTGQLSLTYQQLIRKRKINGYYCEVILVEGVVRVVEGSGGTVKVGDILYPGTKLSLSAAYGTNAQLGLRFINGTDAELVQDVFTNACITDLITIGSTDFSNQSVIQGKTALMSASRYLCEQATGMPNTPEEWARATGKLVVKTAASVAVPGSGLAAYAIKYGVKTAAGKAYDYVMTSPGSNKKERVFEKTTSPGIPRVELSTYYDGSTRVAESIPGAMSLYALNATTPLTTVDGFWREITTSTTVGRTWSETPDTIDKEGPRLRMSYDFDPNYSITRFELTACDSAGLDADSLSVLIDGLTGDQAASFTRGGENTWTGDFIGMYYYGYHLTVTLRDKLGNGTTLEWRGASLPEAPTITQVGPASIYQSKTSYFSWSPPTGMSNADVRFYEIRQRWYINGGWQTGPWLSVGPVSGSFLDMPTTTTPPTKYYLEVRAITQAGLAGPAAQTDMLSAVPKAAAWGWPLFE